MLVTLVNWVGSLPLRYPHAYSWHRKVSPGYVTQRMALPSLKPKMVYW